LTNPDRKRIGKWASAVAREAVYQTPEGIEVETNEHYEVTTRRVFFEDVQLVTYHREYGKLYLTLTGIFALGFTILVIFLANLPNQAWVIAIMMGIFGAPFVIAFLLRLIFGVDVVTVFGRRSKAAIRFKYRKKRARVIYGQICSAVSAAQRRREEEFAAADAAVAEQPPVTGEEQPPMPPAESL
jgi:hypothetical protein